MCHFSMEDIFVCKKPFERGEYFLSLTKVTIFKPLKFEIFLKLAFEALTENTPPIVVLPQQKMLYKGSQWGTTTDATGNVIPCGSSILLCW